MAAIGILGGMGPQASAHLQNLLVHDAPKHLLIESDTDFPEIILLSVPVPNFIEDKDHIAQAKQILTNRLPLFEQAGCIVNGIACNTAHLLLADLESATYIPFVSIPRLVAKEVERNNFRRVGLLATPNTMRSTLYDDALGPDVRLIRPDTRVAKQLETFIFEELRGKHSTKNQHQLHKIVETFMSQQRLETVILGCTELPLVFGPSNDICIIDTLQVLSSGLLSAFATLRKSGC